MSDPSRPPGEGSSYMAYLPAIFQQDLVDGRANPLGRFLRAFEQVLTGLGDDPDAPGLEEILDGIVDPRSGAVRLAGIQRYFDPGHITSAAAGQQLEYERAPAAFLDWLAGWVALSLRADLGVAARRELIARAVQLYRIRGTARGLAEVARIYNGLGVTVQEYHTPFQIGVSQLGYDTILDGGAPHFFRVLLRLSSSDPELIRRQTELIRAIIEMEKPAHTVYALEVVTPTLRIGYSSTVGVDTLLSAAVDAP